MVTKYLNTSRFSPFSVVTGRVSVVMPCFNVGPFVGEAIESVLTQTYSDVELIIVDDGSTDNSLEVIHRYAGSVRLLTQTNQGPSVARNRGISESTGEFIAFLDADDYWEPDFIKKLVLALRSSDAVLAYCGWQNIMPNDKSPPPFIPPEYENKAKRVALLKNAALWPIHGILTYRDAVLDIGGFDENLPACEDYDLWLRLTFVKPIIRVEQVLSYYRHHKFLKDTNKRGLDAEYMRCIKKAFVNKNPDLVRDLPVTVLRDCIDGGFMRRGYQCYWRRELISARHIFLIALRERAFSFGDLKYLLPALLPKKLYKALINRADKH